MRGKEVPNPCSAIRLFAMCDAMKWAHLPVFGGIYDQDPEFLDRANYIFSERSKEQEREHKRNQASAAQNKMKRSAARGR